MPIANKPILFYGLEAIRDAGIVDVGIIVGDTAKEIEAAVGDGATFGLKVTYIKQDAPLGLAHAVKIAEDIGYPVIIKAAAGCRRPPWSASPTTLFRTTATTR